MVIKIEDVAIGNNIVEVPLFINEESELWLVVEKVNQKTFLALIDNRNQSIEDKVELGNPVYFSHSPKELDGEVINEIILKCGKIIGEDIDIKPNLAYAFLVIAEYYNEIFNQEDDFESLYGRQTKETARKIFKTDPMAYFLEVLNLIHQGDDIEKEVMILAEFTAHVMNANTVPVFIKGSPGAGKSSLNNAVSKIIPPRFLLGITSLSSKALFYNMKEISQDYIKLVCNDFFDSDVVAFVKDWADTTEESTLKHMTVVNGEGVTLEIECKRGLSVTSADSMTNQQVNRRMYHLNPQENEDHLNRTQRFILNKSVEQNSEIVDNAIEVANALYDLIINDEFIVFNPWLEHIDVNGYSPTRLKHILHMIMARTLIYRYQREEIMEGILLGTKEDVERVLELDNQLNYLQTSQLPLKAFEITDYLEQWDYAANIEDNKEFGITLAQLVKETGIAKTTLRNWIFGRDDILGLQAMGLIKSVKSDPNNDKFTWLLFKSEAPFEDDHDNHNRIKALKDVQIDPRATLSYFIACQPDKVLRDDILQEKMKDISTLKNDEEILEFLEMAKNELIVDNTIEERLNNPIVEDFINKFEISALTAGRMDKQEEGRMCTND